MTIYIDIIIVENLIMNYIILYATGLISKSKKSYLRMFLASLIGAIYATLEYALKVNIYSNIILKTILSIIIVYVAFYPQNAKKMCKQLIIFYVTTFTFGGIATYLIYVLKPQNIIIKNGMYVGTYVLKVIFIGAIIGTIGLMKSVNTFNSEKKIKLATYASRCIENEILMYLRRNNKIKTEVSIDEPLNKDSDGNELLLSDILGTDPDITYRNLEDEVDMKLLKEAIRKLNSREKNIMEMRFGFISGREKTQKEVADELGISQSYISRLEKKIIGKMRKDIMSKTG